jgi:hypothetical protein
MNENGDMVWCIDIVSDQELFAGTSGVGGTNGVLGSDVISK